MSIDQSSSSHPAAKNGVMPILGFVMVMIVLGHHIPAAGGLLFFNNGFQQQEVQRFSIFALGQQQWFTAWAAFQLYVLVKHRLTHESPSVAQVANFFDRKVLLITLLFSSIAWYGLIIAQIEFFSPAEVSAVLVASGIVTGLAGTCLLFFLGRCLDYIWPNYGFWILFLLLGLYTGGASLVSDFAWITDGIRTGALSPKMAGASLLLLVLAAFLGALVAGCHIKNKTSEPQHLFAVLLLASVVTQFVASILVASFQEAVVSGVLSVSNTLFNIVFIGIYLATLFAALLAISIFWLGQSGSWQQTLLIVVAPTLLLAATEFSRIYGVGTMSSVDLLFWSIATWFVYKALLTRAPFKHWLEAPQSALQPDDKFDDEFRRGWRN